MKKNRVLEAGLKTIERGYKEAKGKSRHEEKKLGRDEKLIFSKQSLINHERNWRQFAEWAHGKGVRNLSKVSLDHIKAFLEEKSFNGGRDGRGASKKTIQSYATTFNKVMKMNDREIRVEVKELGLSFNEKTSYKHLTAEEWREENIEDYENNKEVIDTMRAFGLRAKEIRELNEKSFLSDGKTGKIFVQTIGKGGKMRIAEATDAMNEEMKSLYADICIQIEDIRAYKPDERLLARNIHNEGIRLNLKGSKSHKLPKHIFRSEYARTLLKERIERYRGYEMIDRGYTRVDVQRDDLKSIRLEMGTFRGSAQAFIEVSRNLGHNRLDVLTKYVCY